MPGRFTLAHPHALPEAFPWLNAPSDIPPAYNLAPGQPVPVVPNDGEDTLDFYLWGLIPSWTRRGVIGRRLINARGETVAEKPSFRAAYKRRRCLILADGIYEWVKLPGKRGKTPHYIKMKSGQPFALAGLWEDWHAPDDSIIKTCTIITTTPNHVIKPLHDRMAVILPPEAYATWLTPGDMDAEQLDHLLKPYPGEEMTYHVVSKLVNDPSNDLPDCILPVD